MLILCEKPTNRELSLLAVAADNGARRFGQWCACLGVIRVELRKFLKPALKVHVLQYSVEQGGSDKVRQGQTRSDKVSKAEGFHIASILQHVNTGPTPQGQVVRFRTNHNLGPHNPGGCFSNRHECSSDCSVRPGDGPPSNVIYP